MYNADESEAGTVIINTCGFIRDAKEESIDTILSFVKAQKAGKIKNLYVMGCLAERYMHELQLEIPEVRKYFGVNDLTGVLRELGLTLKDDLLTDRMLTGPGHYAFLKISEGCNRTCSFCAIPAIRGQYVSRPVEELTEEAYKLAKAGVRELILIAQDLSFYGMDLYKKQALPGLVKELLRIKQFEWIRLHYLYPAGFPMELLDIVRGNNRLCRYFDIPIQHISDRMLKLMRRSHNRAETEYVLNTIRQEIPDAVIRTTLISGHPGETEEDHTELRNFVSNFRFDRLGVFAYSHEEDTFSHKNYKDEIPDDVKEARVSELMELQQDISSEINAGRVGQVLKVLIDRQEGKYLIGRSEFDSPEVDQEILIPSVSGIVPGEFCMVIITEATEFDLYGKPI